MAQILLFPCSGGGMARWLGVGLALFSVACEDRVSCEAAAELEPALRVGVGERDFEAVHDGDVLPREWGSQGGSHVWMAVQTEGIAPGTRAAPPYLEYTLYGDGDEIGYGTDERPLRGDAYEGRLAGGRLFLDGWLEEEPEDYVLAVFLRDRCGTELTVEHAVALQGGG